MRKMNLVWLILSLVPALVSQSGGQVQVASVTLTSAQLLHLKATPVQLVPAPGPGMVINAISATLQYKAGTIPYTGPGGNGIAISVPGESSSFLVGPAVGFIDQSTDHINQLSPGGPVFSRANAENAALIIRNNDAGEWSGGDGTVIVTVYYTIVTLQ